jgi:hypothetical protein
MIDFDDALITFGKVLVEILGTEAALYGRIVRDIYGRLSFVTSRPHNAVYDELQMKAAQVLGAYGEATQLVVSLDESGFHDLLAEPSVGVARLGRAGVKDG